VEIAHGDDGWAVGRTAPVTQTVGVHVHYPDLHPTLEEGLAALTGTADEIAAGLAAHADEGADDLIAWLVPSTPEALARFAEAAGRFRRLR
jgi:hypothetical protein